MYIELSFLFVNLFFLAGNVAFLLFANLLGHLLQQAFLFRAILFVSSIYIFSSPSIWIVSIRKGHVDINGNVIGLVVGLISQQHSPVEILRGSPFRLGGH